MSLIVNAPQLLLFSQLTILRALVDGWSATYSQRNLCALEGSTVFMNVAYTHPTGLTVKNRFWAINPIKGKEPTDLRNEPAYSGRVAYLGDEQKHFSLRLSDVKKTDEHEYCFRVAGTRSMDKYLFYPGIRLNVTELQVEAPEKVVEGNATVLRCSTNCSLSGTPAFIWYKDDLRIGTDKNHGNTLTLQPTKADDTGSYKCAVSGYERLRSPARSLSVRHRPKSVSVSISSSGVIVEGSSVTLTCSSDANPPVETYTWFKEKTAVGEGKTYTISKISSEHRGEYKCKSSNEVGHQYSSSVTLNISDGRSQVPNAVIAVITACLASLALVLTAVLLRRKKMYCWSEGRIVKDDSVAAHHAAGDAPQSSSRSANQDESHYMNIGHLRKAPSPAVTDSEQVLYAVVQQQGGKVANTHQKDDVQYATVHVSSSHRLDAGTAEDSSVIYSRVK